MCIYVLGEIGEFFPRVRIEYTNAANKKLLFLRKTKIEVEHRNVRSLRVPKIWIRSRINPITLPNSPRFYLSFPLSLPHSPLPKPASPTLSQQTNLVNPSDNFPCINLLFSNTNDDSNIYISLKKEEKEGRENTIDKHNEGSSGSAN